MSGSWRSREYGPPHLTGAATLFVGSPLGVPGGRRALLGPPRRAASLRLLHCIAPLRPPHRSRDGTPDLGAARRLLPAFADASAAHPPRPAGTAARILAETGGRKWLVRQTAPGQPRAPGFP